MNYLTKHVIIDSTNNVQYHNLTSVCQNGTTTSVSKNTSCDYLKKDVKSPCSSTTTTTKCTKSKKSTMSCNYNVKRQNIICGECTCKITMKQKYVTCKNCTLNYHIDCIDSSVVEASIDWYCDSCFTKICNDELPLGQSFIDLKCKLQKGLKIAHLNIQGILQKVDYLDILLHDNNVDVLCVSETWLTNNIDDSEVMINGYNLCRLDRSNGKMRGGVMCYIKENLCFKQNVDIHDDEVESIFVEINLPNTKPVAVGTIYRPPDSTVDYIDKLDELFQKCNIIYDDVYILGDFNLDIHKKYECKKVSNLSKNSQMCQLITDYTRVTENSKTTIDLIFVSRPELIISSGVHSLGLSDHSLIYVVRKHKQIKLPPRTVRSRNFKNFDESQFVNTIKSIDWNQVNCIDNVDDALCKWQSLFNEACDKNAPFKTKRIKGHLPEWVDNDFLALCKDRDYLYAKAHKTNDQDDWKKAKSVRNRVNNMKFYLKKKYCERSINDNMHDSKNLWKSLKKIIPSSKPSSLCNIVNSSDHHDGQTDKDAANSFNQYFTSVGQELSKEFDNVNVKCPCDDVRNKFQCNNDSFKFHNVSASFVYEQLCSMDNNKSTGLDLFNVKLLKLAAPYVSQSLAHICNLSLNTSKFPDDWKKAKVTPIFKSGDKSNVSNYRPISVLPIISKIIERNVHNQLYAYLCSKNILSDSQSGFRSKHSTTTTLLDVQDYILNNMDKGLATGVIFLDLKKAFDTVNHEILIKKLAKYGINGNELNWFKSYLHNRSQAVRVNSSLSDFKTYNTGIPQGSILGPLLFIIFVNCLPDIVTCKTVMYADDTSLMCKAKNVDDLKVQLESNLKAVAQWFQANKLTLNTDKTKFMVFGTSHILDQFSDITVTFNDKVIEKVDVFKYLGIKFDSNMSWSSQIDYLSGNVSKRIGVVKRVKYFLPQKTLVMLSNALVIPYFDYASSVWSNCSATNKSHLQVLHNRLARTILSADIRTPIDIMLDSLNWIRLSERWNNHMLILTFKCIKKMCPDYLCNQFNFVHNTHNHRTRSQTTNTLIVPKSSSNSGDRTFIVRAARLWNNLPQVFRADVENMSMYQFKSIAVNSAM